METGKIKRSEKKREKRREEGISREEKRKEERRESKNNRKRIERGKQKRAIDKSPLGGARTKSPGWG